jgi:hypothetical protein
VRLALIEEVKSWEAGYRQDDEMDATASGRDERQTLLF